MTVAGAYAVCSGIAQREAKNFYYAFRVLPKAKRNAMCAVYAFMRRADDIADDESMSVPERRLVMAQWLGRWREARSSGLSEDPVFLALNDTQKRFGIPDALLEDLVRGTTLDLEDRPAGVTVIADSAVPDETRTLQVYESFDDLHRYCYLVASVVGLVCIRIFGYRDPRAEALAEKTGIAFQLTNILRDVREDAERGRVYLPLQDLRDNQVALDQLLRVVRGRQSAASVRKVMDAEGARALGYYQAAEELFPLIDRDSRAALWVLVTIYRGLLERIIARDYDVFSERVSVPASKKLLILGRGMGMALRNRMGL
ncbi:MAG: phytoene/squalene synthase family protein [Acidobacteriota bacterium]|nr:phytoene/squalene synthase family protein [Acidobacteriota bacterium]